MLRFLGKATASASRNCESISMEVCGGEEELSTWEIVNAAHSDEEDLYSYDSEETVSISDDLESIHDEKDDETDDDADVDGESPAPFSFVSPSDIIAIQAMSVSPPMDFPVDLTRNYVDHEYDDEEDVDDDYDVDDELVPWKLKGRFGKQRIVWMDARKSGQRGETKLKTRNLPYYNNRPGFSGGKLRL